MKRFFSLLLSATLVLSLLPAQPAKAAVSSAELNAFLLPLSSPLIQVSEGNFVEEPAEQLPAPVSEQLLQNPLSALPSETNSGFLLTPSVTLPTVGADGFIQEPSQSLPSLPAAGGFLAEIGAPDPEATVITTAEELAAIKGGNYVLGCDIDLSTYNGGIWAPNFLTSDLTLDGQGHKILNLNIPADSAALEYVGLFSCYHPWYSASGSITIRNLGMDKTVEGVSVNGPEFAGALIGYAPSTTTIENCYNTIPVSVVDETYETTTFAGGLIGSISDGQGEYLPVCTMTNCYNTGAITASANLSYYAQYETPSSAGGLLGNMSSSIDSVEAIFKGCINIGTLSGASCDGGLLGSIRNTNGTAKVTAENSHNTGTITGDRVGGLVGYAATEENNPIQISFANCANSGNISATQEESDIWSAGGLLGYTNAEYYTWDDVSTPSTTTITNCYNSGVITTYAIGGGLLGQVDGQISLTDCYNSGSISGYNTLGGLIADATGYHTMEYNQHIFIHRCFNTGDIIGLPQVYEDWYDGTVYYSYYLSYAGGLIGKGSMVLGGTVSSSFNAGDITGTVCDPCDAPLTAGGLAGSLYADFTDCCNSGDVLLQADPIYKFVNNAALGGLTGYGIGALSNCYNTGDVQFISSPYGENGTVDAGGLVGNAVKSPYDTEDRIFSATSCYNSGNITAPSNAGGIVAYSDEISAFSHCYNTGNVTASSDIAAGLGYCLTSTVTVQSCFNTGAIAGGTNAAGLVLQWHATDTTYSPVSHLTRDCYNTGNILATGEESVAAGLSLTRDYYDPSCYGFSTNCYNTGKVSATDAYGLGSGTFSHCYNTGSITANSIASGLGYGSMSHCANMGTIQGVEAYGLGTTPYNTGTITYSWNSGDVIGTSIGYGVGYTGSFNTCYNSGNVISTDNAAGLGNGSAASCFNTGAVTGHTYASGLVYDVYYVGGYLRNCYNTGSVLSTNPDGCVAGLLSHGGNSSGNPYTITNCANLADITSKGRVIGIANTSLNPSLTISRCYNTGDITSTNGHSAAGLALYCYSISDSCNLGNITSTGGTTGITVGGLTYNAPYTMHNCYNTGAVSASGSSDGVGIIAGGLAGLEMYYDFHASYCYNSGKISSYNGFLDTTTYAAPNNGNSCEEIANMSAEELANSSPCYHPGKTYAGGLLGEGDITISNCRSLGSYSAFNDPSANCRFSYRHTGPYTGDGSVDDGTSSVGSRLILSIQNKVDAGKDHRVMKPDDTITLSVYFSAPENFDHNEVTFSTDDTAVQILSATYKQSTSTTGNFTVTLKADPSLKENKEVTFTANAVNDSEKANDICRILVDTENTYTFYVGHFGSMGDEDNYSPLEGASVTVNGVTKTTASNGYVSFTKEETNCPYGVCSFSASNDGYFTIDLPYKAIYTNQVNHVYLREKEKDKIYITGATIHTNETVEDILTRSYPLDLIIETQETCYTSVSVDWNEMDVGTIKLIGAKSGKSYTLTPGGSGFIPYWSTFDADETIKIYASTYNKEGKFIEETISTKLTVTHLAPEIQMPSSGTATTKDDDPMIGGLSMGIKWDKLLNKSDYKNTNKVNVAYSDGVCSVTFEISTRDGVETPKRTPVELFDFASSAPRLEVSAKGTLNVPIMEGKVGGGTIGASVMLLPSKETEEKYNMNKDNTQGVAWEWDLPTWAGTPLYGKFGIGGKATVDATVSVPREEYLFETIEGFLVAENYSSKFGLEGVLEVEGGVGGDIKKDTLGAKAGLKFTGTPFLGFTYVYGQDVTFTPQMTGMGSIVLGVDIFALDIEAQVDVGGFEWSPDGFYWLDHNGNRVEQAEIHSATMSRAASTADNRMSVVSGSYLEHGGGFSDADISLFGLEDSSSEVIYENIFTNSSAALAEVNGEKVLYFTTDAAANGSRTRANALMLVETQPEAAVREMAPIEDDGTLDASFAADGTVVVWEDANQIFGDSIVLSDLLAAKDITAAVKVNGSWSVTSLTGNNCLDFAPAVAQAADGTTLAAWLSNSANDYTAQTGVTNLHYALYDGTTWSSVQTLPNVGAVTSVDVLYDGTNAMLVYKSDLAEHNITLSTSDLTGQDSTTGLEMYRYCTAMVNGEKKLAWFDESDTLHLPDGSTVETEYDGFSNPVITVENGEICVFWTEFDGIYYTTNRTGSFSKKLHLHESTGMIWNLDARQNYNGSYYLSWLETNTLTQENGSGTYRRTDLMVMEAQPGVDLVLENVVVQEDTYAQLGLVTGTAYVRNNGNTAVSSAELTIWADSYCLLSQTVDGTIAPGETIELPFTCIARDPGSKGTYTLLIEAGNAKELAEDDNEYTFTIGTADAAMTACNVIEQEDGTTYLRLRAANKGSTTLRNVSIAIYDENMENPVEVITGKTIYAGESVDWLANGIPLSPETTYYAKIIADSDEASYNDSCMFISPKEPLENGVAIQSISYDSQDKTLSVKLEANLEADATYRLLLTVMNANGQMVTCYEQPLSLLVGESTPSANFSLSILSQGNYVCKAFVVDRSFVPMCASDSCNFTVSQ